MDVNPILDAVPQREVTLTEQSQVILLLSCGHWHEFWASDAGKQFEKGRRPGCLRCRPANHDATVQGVLTRDRGISRAWIEES